MSVEPAAPGLDADRSLYERAACGLLLTDAHGVILRVNATFCGWVGFTASELVGRRRVQDLFTMGGRVFHQTHLLPLLQMQGSVAEVQVDLRHADGSALPTWINIFRRSRAGATFDELAVFIATDRRQYERELLLARRNAEASLKTLAETQQALRESRDVLGRANADLARADRQKDEFLATLAHELRNPLAPLQNVLQILKLKGGGEPQMVWAREVFERQMTQMAHLVDDLMDVSRITQGRVELRRQPVDVADMMRAAIEAAQALVEASAHRLHVVFPERPVIVDADPTRLTQIFTNLLNNSAKYTPDGGHIWFEARADAGGEEVTVSVRDSGIGISADNLANVFTMFSQLEPALQRSQGGLGIGLALVKGLVALHGGMITAASAGVGQGSEFTVRLPVLQVLQVLQVLPGPALPAAAQPRASGAAPDGAGRAQGVLVVDDNHDGADMLCITLELLGCSAAPHYDGKSALAAGAAFRPDVVILDIGLPDMDGYAVAQEIRAKAWGRDVLLIAATGWGQQKDKDAATEAGFDLHMVKPLDFAALKSALAASRAQDAALGQVQ